MRYKEETGACRLIAVTLEYYAVVTLPALVSEAALAPADLDRHVPDGGDIAIAAYLIEALALGRGDVCARLLTEELPDVAA